MDDVKVTITDEDIYGFEVKSPNFKPEVKVKFALDISVLKKRELQKEADSLKNFMGVNVDTLSAEEKVEHDKSSKKYGEMIVKMVILDWNLYDTNGVKLEINADTLDTKLSTRLSEWIMNTAMGFFMKPDKTA